jgi:hypothetical protein
MSESIEASFRIVTPMFIGGADQTPADGIRPPSVKGALRFWWRALNWGRIREQTSCDEVALQLLTVVWPRRKGWRQRAGMFPYVYPRCHVSTYRPDQSHCLAPLPAGAGPLSLPAGRIAKSSNSRGVHHVLGVQAWQYRR